MDANTYAAEVRRAKQQYAAALEEAGKAVRAAEEKLRRAEDKRDAAQRAYHLRLAALAEELDKDGGQPGRAAFTPVKVLPPPRLPAPAPATATAEADDGKRSRAAAAQYEDEILALALELIGDRRRVDYGTVFRAWGRRWPNKRINRSTFSGIMQRLGRAGKLDILVPGGPRKPTIFGPPKNAK